MATSRQLAPEVSMVMFMSPFGAPRWGWDLWRFASLIPSGCRLPPIHKVMGDHASRGATPAGLFLSRGSSSVIHFVPRKRFRRYRECLLGRFVPKKRFNLHQMCVRPCPVRTKTFSAHHRSKFRHVVSESGLFTHER